MQNSCPNKYLDKNNATFKWLYALAKTVLFWLGTLVIFAASSAVTKPYNTICASIVTITLALIGSIGLTILFAKWGKLKLEDIGLMPNSKSISHVLAGFAIGLVLAFLQPLLVLMAGHIRLVLSPRINFAMLGCKLLLFVLVACREEVVFRGYPLQSMARDSKIWAALLVVTCLFIIEHHISGSSWTQAILGPGAGGLLFGLAALRTKGIALSIGLHLAWNFGQWLLGFKNETGIYQVVIEKGFEARTEQIGWISYLLVMAIAILAMLYWRKRLLFITIAKI